MSGAELRQWWIYYQMEPFGEARADLRMATQTTALTDMWSAKGQAKVSDFMPDFYKAPVMPTKPTPSMIKQSQAAFLQMTQMVGGTIIRPGGGQQNGTTT